MASNHSKIKLREVNRHLVCRLCRGYYVDATTIAECLHSFCRSCIIKYLKKNSFCPICEVQIHKTKPYLNLRLDKALQDVVYKLVPGLYHDEMKRRRDFYSKRQEQIPFATPEQCGLEERIIFAPDDSISLSLEYLESDELDSETVSSRSSESGDNSDALPFPQQLGLKKLKNDGKISRRESEDVQENSVFPKRYLQCPAVVNIGHLKKFIRMKHELTDKMQVSVIHKRVPLPDHYTLMDVAYIFTWKRSAPLRFFYQIYQTKKHNLKTPPAINGTEKSKSQSMADELKSVDNAANDKICNNDGAGIMFSEVDEIVKINDDRNETVISEFKQTVQNNILKNVDTNKPVAESETAKSETAISDTIIFEKALSETALSGKAICETAESETVLSETVVKSGPSVNGVKQEAKDGFETECNTTITHRDKKCEKPKTKTKHKRENQRKKNVKAENSECIACGVKENEFKSNKILLSNSNSEQLESKSSDHQIMSRSNVNGKIKDEEKKEIGESHKKEVVNKILKKPEPQNSKDSKKSKISLLKSFRKEKLKAEKDAKVEIKNSRGSSLTITPVSKDNKPPEKEEANFHVEIKPDIKGSEYDFDGSSPPGKIIPLHEFSKYSKYSKYMAEHRDKWLFKESKNDWMPFQNFRDKMLKENDFSEVDVFSKNKKKLVPYLYKIKAEENKKFIRKTPNGKLPHGKPKANKTPSTVIKPKTGHDELLSLNEADFDPSINSPLQSMKIENKDGEYSVKFGNQNKPNAEKVLNNPETKSSSERLQNKRTDGTKSNDSTKELSKKVKKEETENKNLKNLIINLDKVKSDTVEAIEAIDLSKSETVPKSGVNPLKNLMDMANKTSPPKSDEKLFEPLLSAQNQNMESLLKIPQYSQTKNSPPQSSLSSGKNISPNDITQALQILEGLRTDIKALEAKKQLDTTSVLEEFAQKSGSYEPYQQLYQQKIDLIRRLKRHRQMMPGDLDASQIKQLKLSPTLESKKKLSPPPPEQKAKTSPVLDEIAPNKSSLERTFSQIQLMELQNRMLAAHNFKNLPALLQYYSRPPIFCSGQTPSPKSNQPKIKSSSHSLNQSSQSLNSSSGNSPLSSSAAPDSSFFNSQNYNHLINPGLNSEMTYHQMFQSYLNQQEQINQVKHSQLSKKPVKFNEVSPKSISDKYYLSRLSAKVQKPNSLPSDRKS